MIAKIQPVPAGNALRLFIDPPAGAVAWRVLRRTADAFTGPDDAGAVLVADDSGDNAIMDTAALVNGTAYFYRAYYRDGAGAWTASATETGTPAATYEGSSFSPQAVYRERLALGLAVEVQRGALKPDKGRIPVVMAPFAMVDGVTFPCVSVHLDSDTPDQRAIGEVILTDEMTQDGGWLETEGWLSSVTLNIVGASLNPDERMALREAIKRVTIANLPIFADAGFIQPQLNLRDTEQFSENAAPLYLTAGTFTCIAPSWVRARFGPLSDVTLTGIGEYPNGP